MPVTAGNFDLDVLAAESAWSFHNSLLNVILPTGEVFRTEYIENRLLEHWKRQLDIEASAADAVALPAALLRHQIVPSTLSLEARLQLASMLMALHQHKALCNVVVPGTKARNDIDLVVDSPIVSDVLIPRILRSASAFGHIVDIDTAAFELAIAAAPEITEEQFTLGPRSLEFGLSNEILQYRLEGYENTKLRLLNVSAPLPRDIDSVDLREDLKDARKTLDAARMAGIWFTPQAAHRHDQNKSNGHVLFLTSSQMELVEEAGPAGAVLAQALRSLAGNEEAIAVVDTDNGPLVLVERTGSNLALLRKYSLHSDEMFNSTGLFAIDQNRGGDRGDPEYLYMSEGDFGLPGLDVLQAIVFTHGPNRFGEQIPFKRVRGGKLARAVRARPERPAAIARDATPELYRTPVSWMPPPVDLGATREAGTIRHQHPGGPTGRAQRGGLGLIRKI